MLGADYSTGSLNAVGPGFLPRLLSWSLVALGIIIAVADRLGAEAGSPEGGPNVEGYEPRYVVSGFSRSRALVCITAGIVGFALLIDSFGLLIAGGTLLVIGAGASQDFRWREVMVLAAALLLFSWALFVSTLGLPIPTWPR